MINQKDQVEFISDFETLLYASLGINDQLNIDIDHVEFEGSMNQAERFRELVNNLHWKYVKKGIL